MTVTNMWILSLEVACAVTMRTGPRHLRVTEIGCEYWLVTGAPNGVGFVRLLGPVQVVLSSGRIVELPSASQRRLLAVLALHARAPVRAEWLADTLGVSQGALRTTVSRLRKVLGDAEVQTTTTGYRLDVDVDAEMFCREIADAPAGVDGVGVLESALARWVGPALEEFANEGWAAGEVARLAELHASAIESLAAALIAGSRFPEAIALLDAHVAACPLRDRPRALLMEALAADGRQAEALRVFQDYRKMLADELGTEPSVETRAIEQRIATDWTSAEVHLPAPAALAPVARLIGRSFERRILTDAAARARSDGLQTVVLCGEPGIGKTTVLSAFAKEVRDGGGGTVLYARCDDGAAVPLQPFRSLIRWCVDHVSTVLLEAHAARCGGALQRVAPQLAQRVAVPEPTTSDDATDRFLLFEAVADLLRRIARDELLVMMLDDLHWAEPTALSLLQHLTRSLGDAPVLLIASHRDSAEYVTDPLRSTLAELYRNDARCITLRGFDDAELADLVALEAGAEAPAIAARLRDDSAGNPLYATQLIRHWVESGRVERELDMIRWSSASHGDDVPQSLREVVWSRVGALGGDTAAVLAAGAVLGVEFDDRVLRELVEFDGVTVDRALDAAIASGLVLAIEPAKAMRFAHALVADALYAELQPLQRRRMHGRAARALDVGSNAPPQRTVVQLARHCALGDLLADAKRWAMVAGDHALAHLAPREAASWYQVALEHCVALECVDEERAELVVRLGTALHRAGDPDAYATLQEGADLAQRCGAQGALVRAALATDRGFMQVGAFAPQQLAIVEAAVAGADADDVDTYARLLALFAQTLIHTPRAQLRADVARRALDLATTSANPNLLPAIASSVLYALWAPGSSALRADIAARAVAAAAESRDPLLEFSTHVAAYTVAIEIAEPVAAASSLATLRALAAEIGAPRMRWTVGIYETFDAMMAARLDDAERLAAENLELGLQIGEPDAFTVYASQFFALGTFGGRHAELFPVVEQASKDAPTASPLRLAYAIICAAVGDEDTARGILAEGQAAAFTDAPTDVFWMTSMIGYAVLAIELQDEDAAEQLFPIIEPFTAEVAFNGATSQGPIAAYLGKLASLLGRHDVADACLRAALDTTTAFGWEYHRATTLIALAQSRLRRIGALDSDARALLAEAEAICSAHGLASWAKHIEVLRG
jgi:DNA-binding SARP family transcriptional activator